MLLMLGLAAPLSAQVATRYSSSVNKPLIQATVSTYRPVPQEQRNVRYYGDTGVQEVSRQIIDPQATTQFSTGARLPISTLQLGGQANAAAPQQPVSLTPISYTTQNVATYGVQPVMFEQTAVSPLQAAPATPLGPITVTPLDPINQTQTVAAYQSNDGCCTPTYSGATTALLPTTGECCPQPALGVQAYQPAYTAQPLAVAPANYNQGQGYQPLIPLRGYPTTAYVGQGIFGQPKAYVPDQPVRNFFRYVLP